MSQVNKTVSESLVACGFTSHDMEELGTIIGASAEITDDNLKAMEPLQDKFSRFLKKLPTTNVEDADGNLVPKTDTTTNAFKDFMASARNMAMDRLCFSQRYVVTFAKVPTPTGALMWADISTLKDADGKKADIDPTKFRHFTTTGTLIDPRRRFKTDDPDLVDQVIKPMRGKFKRAANTTLSRLKTKAGGGAKTQDPAKKFDNAVKPIKAMYKWAKDEAFPVKDEAALNKALKQIRIVCGFDA